MVDGELDDIIVNYQYHMRMKRKGVILNNIDYDDDDYSYYKGVLPPGVKSISFYSADKYDIEEIRRRKIEIRTIKSIMKRIEIPNYQTRIDGDLFCRNYYHEVQKKVSDENERIKRLDSFEMVN